MIMYEFFFIKPFVFSFPKKKNLKATNSTISILIETLKETAPYLSQLCVCRKYLLYPLLRLCRSYALLTSLWPFVHSWSLSMYFVNQYLLNKNLGLVDMYFGLPFMQMWVSITCNVNIAKKRSICKVVMVCYFY